MRAAYEQIGYAKMNIMGIENKMCNDDERRCICERIHNLAETVCLANANLILHIFGGGSEKKICFCCFLCVEGLLFVRKL